MTYKELEKMIDKGIDNRMEDWGETDITSTKAAKLEGIIDTLKAVKAALNKDIVPLQYLISQHEYAFLGILDNQ
jgi:hypothetical protein